MPHIVYFAAASLDGRIAGPGHALDFLAALEEPGSYGDAAFDPFFETVDALVMGATTFQVLRAALADGDVDPWPYGDRPTWVMTRRGIDVATPGADVRPFSGAPREFATALDDVGLRRVWLVGGGALAAAFVQDDLVDEIRLTVVPTLVGAGPSLADAPDLSLRRFRIASVAQGANSVALRYIRDGSGE